MTDEEKLKLIVKTLDSKKAEDIRVIKIRDLTILASYFVIADGTSNTHTRSLANEVEFKLGEAGIQTEVQGGGNGSNWTVIDCTDIVVHIFYKETRNFYNLERLWQDGTDIDISGWLSKD